ncbi:hypothetical protein PUN28_014034 [Cardiocondyla obscurior]|uniref:Uncharacterized protein n=1 Tax=Cardiocondyla obscurior TaxID=286306 RepID=A0AAW2FA22_9HYME
MRCENSPVMTKSDILRVAGREKESISFDTVINDTFLISFKYNRNKMSTLHVS